MFDFFAREDSSGLYPIHRLEQSNAAGITAFLCGLDAATLEARFQRYTDAAMIRAHVAGIDWASTSVLAWSSAGAIRGLVETAIFEAAGALEAETALSVHPDWRGRGIGRHLLAAAADAAREAGVSRCVIVLGPRDGGQARLVRGLGGRIDWERSLALLVH